jgi:hypothetical protein
MRGIGIGSQFNTHGRCFGNGSGGVSVDVFAESRIYIDPFVFLTAGK